MEITIGGMELTNVMKKTIRFCKIVDRFYEKGASGTNHQIRTAAPHFEMCFGHGWANFNTQSVQTCLFHVLLPREAVAIKIADMDLANFQIL